MKTISSISSISNLIYHCDVCPLTRQSKLPFPASSIKFNSAFELVHIDTWELYKSPTHDGYKYFLIIVDNFTRCTWTYLLRTKNSVFHSMKHFLSTVETQFSFKVKIVRSDNALELEMVLSILIFIFLKALFNKLFVLLPLNKIELLRKSIDIF